VLQIAGTKSAVLLRSVLSRGSFVTKSTAWLIPALVLAYGCRGAEPASSSEGTPPSACETSLVNNDLHCGACNQTCGVGQVCEAEACVPGVLIYGGVNFQAVGDEDVYRFDVASNTFSKLDISGTMPPLRSDHVTVWDGKGNRMLVWGGYDGQLAFLDSTVWALEFATGVPVWVQLPIDGRSPTSRAQAAWVFDEVARKLYVFGGQPADSTLLNDLWVLDVDSLTWTELDSGLSAMAPEKRSSASLVLAKSINALVLFGGMDMVTSATPPGIFDGLWTFSLGTQGGWKKESIPGEPKGLAGPVIFDGDPLYVMGGQYFADNGSFVSSTKAYLLTLGSNPSWKEDTSVEPRPLQRAGAAVAHDGDTYLLFGGYGRKTAFNDLWSFEPATLKWTQLADNDPTRKPGPVGATTMVIRKNVLQRPSVGD
jgi:hypothetical protein